MPPSSCPNCGHALSPAIKYCPECGQKNHSLAVPLKTIAEELLESTLHFDTKLFKTLKLLIFKPGSLSAEFMSGRRKSYVHPIRLYIFISFIFFFLITFRSHHPTGERSPQEIASADREADFNLSVQGIKTSELRTLTKPQIDSLMNVRGIGPTAMNNLLITQLARIAKDGRTEFLHQLAKNVSYMMFVVMPIFGLLVYLLYRKAAKYYMAGLVISVHIHCFIFLLLSLYVMMTWFVSPIFLLLLLPVLIFAYVFLALRSLFRQKAGMTFVKTAAIGFLHLVTLATMLIIVVLVSISLY